MTVSYLKAILDNYSDDMPVMLLTNSSDMKAEPQELIDDHVMLSSETAYVDNTADEDDWGTEDGKVRLGDGQKFLLINPIIL